MVLSMAGDGELLVLALKAQIDELPDRCPGYHKAVLEALTDIVAYERENTMVKINIVQKTREKTEALSKLIETKGGGK